MLWGKKTDKAQQPTYRARRHTRYRTPDLVCPLGQVLDLSASGARIRGRGTSPFRRGASVQITLSDPAHTLIVAGKVAWARRRGLTRFDMGVRFVGLTQEAALSLAQFARFGFVAGRATAGRRRAPAVVASANVEDLYAILGVPRNAPPEQIQSAYQWLSQHFNARRNPEPHAQERQALLDTAFAVLGDRGRRRRYDQLLTRCAA